MQVRHQILAVKDTDDVVQNALVDRKPGIARALDDKQDLVERRADIDRRNFHARHHDVLDLAFGEFQNPLEHACVFVPLLLISARSSASEAATGATQFRISRTLGRKSRQISDSVLGHRIETAA